MNLLIQKLNDQYTAICDQGIVAFNVPKQQCLDAIWDRFPDAPPTEVFSLIDATVAPSEWRSLYAIATAFDLARINLAVESGQADTAEIRQELKIAHASHTRMTTALRDLASAEQSRTRLEARNAYEAEVARLVDVLINTNGAGEYEQLTRNYLRDIKHSTFTRLEAV